MSPRRTVHISFALLLSLTTLGLAGCQRDPAQVAVVQAMATALGKPKTLGARAACTFLVPEQQNRMGCDNLLLPLLHYAPGFAGSRISRRGMTFAGLRNLIKRPLVVQMRYEGTIGSGNLDAVMRREAGNWRVYSLIPVP
jgi:hypothetical protein